MDDKKKKPDAVCVLFAIIIQIPFRALHTLSLLHKSIFACEIKRFGIIIIIMIYKKYVCCFSLRMCICEFVSKKKSKNREKKRFAIHNNNKKEYKENIM